MSWRPPRCAVRSPRPCTRPNLGTDVGSCPRSRVSRHHRRDRLAAGDQQARYPAHARRRRTAADRPGSRPGQRARRQIRTVRPSRRRTSVDHRAGPARRPRPGADPDRLRLLPPGPGPRLARPRSAARDPSRALYRGDGRAAGHRAAAGSRTEPAPARLDHRAQPHRRHPVRPADTRLACHRAPSRRQILAARAGRPHHGPGDRRAARRPRPELDDRQARRERRRVSRHPSPPLHQPRRRNPR